MMTDLSGACKQQITHLPGIQCSGEARSDSHRCKLLALCNVVGLSVHEGFSVGLEGWIRGCQFNYREFIASSSYA